MAFERASDASTAPSSIAAAKRRPSSKPARSSAREQQRKQALLGERRKRAQRPAAHERDARGPIDESEQVEVHGHPEAFEPENVERILSLG